MNSLSILDVAKLHLSSTPHVLKANKRHLELKFWYVFIKISIILKSEEQTRAVMLDWCKLLELDDTIVYALMCSFDLIMRGFNGRNFINNKRITSELVNFGYIEGMPKKDICVYILDKPTNYLKDDKEFVLPTEGVLNQDDYLEKIYTPTIILNDEDSKTVEELLRVFEVDFYE